MKRVKEKKLSPPQVLALGFLSAIVVGTILLILPAASSTQKSIGFINALFTATSATCVTGLIVLDTGKDFSTFGQSVILILLQCGGLGIMTMSTMLAFLVGKKISLKERLIMQESLNQFSIGGLVRLAKYILIFTAVIEIIGATILFFYWQRIYSPLQALGLAVFHSISAFCNAGFSLFSDSIVSYKGDLIINLTFIALIILGGIGFLVLLELFQYGKNRTLSLHAKLALRISFILILIGSIIVFFIESNNTSTMGNLAFSEKIYSSIFQSVTARTAGFNTIHIGSMQNATLFLMIILMFIGASPSSTGGGVKTTTFGLLILYVWSSLKGKEEIQIFKRRISQDIIVKALTVIILSLGLVIIMTILLSYTEGEDFIKVLFEVVSAFSTVGLSTDITSSLSIAGKIIIIITMFTGRIGPLGLALALIQKREPEMIRYPEEKIMVG
ncbi:MAG: TrkH family potassium uptake protein [Atribacterota bacterium]|nr:TrkH family potassium uptake protein [Atribacterota bacterium]